MSKSIADRLAGDVRSLENNIVCQSARIKELREENARLEEDNREAWRRLGNWKSLANCLTNATGPVERENDELRARAESAEARVEELEGENALLEQEATADELRISRLTKERDALRAENERLKADVRKGAFSHLRTLDEMDEMYAAVPRVIEPNEVRKGQVVALRFDTVANGPEWYLDEPGYPASIDSVVTAADTIVLLEDSPEDTGEGADR